MSKDFFLAVAVVFCVIIIVTLIFGIVFYGERPAAIGTNLTNGWYYAKSGRVIEVNHITDKVTFEDCAGYLWDWNGAEDWCVGDFAALLMNSKGTVKVFDDEIISVNFENWGER